MASVGVLGSLFAAEAKAAVFTPILQVAVLDTATCGGSASPHILELAGKVGTKAVPLSSTLTTLTLLMKTKTTLIAAILLAFAALGTGLYTAHDNRQRDGGKRAAQAIAGDDSVDPRSQGNHTARHDAARRSAARLAWLAKEMMVEYNDADGGSLPQSDEYLQLNNNFLEMMMSLSADELKTVIAICIREDTLRFSPAYELRSPMALMIMRLGEMDPQMALALLAETPGRESGLYGDLIEQWAKHDPVAAATWMRDHNELMKDRIGVFPGHVKIDFIEGLTAQDPGLALKLIDEFQIDRLDIAAGKLAEAADTPEQRKQTLAAIREYREAHTVSAE